MGFELTKSEKDQGTINLLKPRVEALVNAARVIAVRSVQEAEAATNVLGQIQERRKKDEATRKSLVTPLNDHVRFINEGFKPLADALGTAESMVKTKLLDWNRAEDARVAKLRREAKEKADQEAEAKAEEARKQAEAEAIEAGFSEEDAVELGGIEKKEVEDAKPVFVPEAIASSPAKTLSTGFARSTRRKVWTFEVEKPESVPRPFLVVEPKLIREKMRADVKRGVEPAPIAGVRFFEEESIAGGR